ncbi:AbrB/MazE/SpoVT family DNA-binding domain-containing protein [Halobium salinum]|uniref:AbrB/MazE/SpoVT family DNA-binding domain-containing protein n=1 Tax=Halobium salinum TaxID=1364940 RepID=A0ABD5PAD4_9EURY|nr:AbrB/MazE/SpoVT family DNA-binding domain-containing protein [Halobium salinum]
MSDERDAPNWPPAMFAERMQQAGEEFTDRQLELFERMMGGGRRSGNAFSDLGSMGSMSFGTAVFKTRVQSGGRISIPDAEREALDIEEGDLVQTFVVPIKRNRESDSDE